jgi:inorganic triphosphatase YgiF
MKDGGAPTEIELTLRLSPKAMARLRRHGVLTQWRTGRAVSRRLVATYYDTPDMDLRDQQVALRVRKVGRRHVQTVKQAPQNDGGLLTRLEDEADVTAGRPDVSLVGHKKLRRMLTAPEVAERLRPVFVTDFRRSVVPLQVRGAHIELAIDQGEIKSDSGSVAICEAELELKEGGLAAVYEVARALNAVVPLQVETLSKAERGYALIDGAAPPVRKAGAIEIPADATVGVAFQQIGRSCLLQLRANAGSARAAVSNESVHQMRVAVRRLRSALYAFRKVLDEGERKRVTGLVRWIMQAMAPARSWDVFVEECLEPLRQHLPDDAARAALESFADDVVQMRRQAHAGVRAALADPRFTTTCLDVEAWWETGGGVEALGEAAALPIEDFARDTLRQLGRRLLEEADGIDHRAGEELHQLRIRAKKVRYAIEFFRGLFRKKAVKPYVAALAAVQERLGAINDALTAQQLLDQLDRERPPTDPAARARARALIAGWASARIAENLAALPDLWSDFAALKPFWR